MKKLLDKYTDKQILERLMQIYPDQHKAGYIKLLKVIRKMKPVKSEWLIFPSKFGTYGIQKGNITSYALDFTKWQEWLGMEVKTKRDGLTALCFCLWEMTYHGFDQRKVQGSVRMMTNRIKDMELKFKNEATTKRKTTN